MRRRRKINTGVVIDEVYKNEVLFFLQKIFLHYDLKSKLIEAYEVDSVLNFLGVDIDEIDEYFYTLQVSLNNDTLLDKNINRLSEIMDLDKAEKIFLKFIVILRINPILKAVSDLLGDLSMYSLIQVLSKIFDISPQIIENMVKNSILIKSNLIEVSTYLEPLYNKISLITPEVYEKMAYLDISIFEMLRSYIKKSNSSNLTLDDYSYIKDIKEILTYLKISKKGVNILFYGLPGMGKTELSKIIADELNKSLYELSVSKLPIEGLDRIKPYKIAQTILNENSIILVDEAEDIFNRDSKRQKAKAWINNMLETNKIPTIWITNDVNAMDEAIIRRFDYVLEFKTPPKKIRKKFLLKYADLSPKTIKILSSHKYLTPAVIERNIKVWKSCSNDEKTLIRMINNTLTAQGYSKIMKKKSKKKKFNLPNFYNPKFINSDENLENIIDGLKENPQARICLYGIAGTGKSAFGKYIAKKLSKEVIIKKGSDLLGMFVGESEKNIANAFKEARDKKAVLIFDEVDSFLQDRNNAHRNWEVTQVNEMLTQMEEFDGIFIATTNLIDNLDKASLRRFDIKIEFKALNSNQLQELFVSVCKELKLKIDKNILDKVRDLDNVTLGDFGMIIRQNRFNKIVSSENLYNKLKQETNLKQNSVKIGLL